MFREQQNIGKARHVVSFHDGVKTHLDGSPFFDIRILGRASDAKRFLRGLEDDGYGVQNITWNSDSRNAANDVPTLAR